MGLIEQRLEHVVTAAALEGQRTRDELAAAFAQTQRSLRIDGAAYRLLRSGLTYTAAGRLVGWSVSETGGTNPVTVDLYDGQGAGAVDDANLVATFTVPAGGSAAHTAMPAGVSFVDGLYAVFTGTGTPHGTVWIGAVD